VEETPLLVAVQGIVGGVQVQPDLAWWIALRFQEDIDQQPIEGVGIGGNLLVAIRRCRLWRTQLQTVQRARGRQRMARSCSRTRPSPVRSCLPTNRASTLSLRSTS